MTAAAIIKGYPVEDKQRAAVVGLATTIMADKTAKTRDRLAAAKLLVAADMHNLKRELALRNPNHGGPNYNLNVNGNLNLDFSKLTNDQLAALIALRQQMEATEDQAAAQSAGGLPDLQLPSPTSDQVSPPTTNGHHGG